MPRITKKMLEEQAKKEELFKKNTNKCIALVTQKLNIIIGVANDDFEDAIKAIYNIFVISQL